MCANGSAHVLTSDLSPLPATRRKVTTMSGLLETIGDPVPAPAPYVSPLRTLATIAACIDTAHDMCERGDIDIDDLDDTARVIAYRVMSRADRLARSAHTWWHGGATHGDESPVSPAPDHYTRVVAQRRTVRTNRGDAVDMVTVHGRAYVQGSTRCAPSPDLSMSAHRATLALDTVPRATHGADAIGVYRMTQVLYGASIPALIGADVLTFHEFRAWDETRAATPRRGWRTRTRLATVRPRTGENVHRVTFHDGQSVAALLAPSHDTAHAWRGHVHYTRPTTVRAQRAQRARPVSRAVVISAHRDLALELSTLAGSAAIGERIAWRTVDEYGADTGTHGALIIAGSAARKRYNVSGLPAPCRNLRTVAGLASSIARAIA